MNHNERVLKEGFEKGLQMIQKVLVDSLVESAYRLLVQAETNKEYHNLTGNTLTSYMVGVYVDGWLSKIVTMYDADTGIEKPTRAKLYRGSGRGTVVVEDYDSGRSIHVKKYNLMDTDKDYGENTSRKFLISYHPKKGNIALVMCTGTEYSEFLESVKHLDVLTQTYRDAERIIKNNWKKIE